jgi:hypothetical protein
MPFALRLPEARIGEIESAGKGHRDAPGDGTRMLSETLIA